ncbi:MAG TPA: hypothetical protein ENK28_04210 [Aliiroseovarius sp.]|nr:hypothetical protein [Aliiroseovarius sp.]
MAELTLTRTRIKDGIWQGELRVTGDDNHQPKIEILHLNESLGGLEVVEDSDNPGHFVARAPIPAHYLTDGVQTFLVMDASTNTRIDAFTIITGQLMDDDIRAELDLLRAELDMLKRAFRRHCVETT